MPYIQKAGFVMVGLLALSVGACADGNVGPYPGDGGMDGSVDGGTPLFSQILEKRTLMVGGGGDVIVQRFGPGGIVEVEIPGDVLPTRVSIDMSLVSGTVRRGRHPVNDMGLYVQPQGLMFQVPIRVRQPVPAPPIGKRYVSVVVPDDGTAFVPRKVARKVTTTDDMAPDLLASMGVWAADTDLEVWEGEGEGSGLWGLALDDKPMDMHPDADTDNGDDKFDGGADGALPDAAPISDAKNTDAGAMPDGGADSGKDKEDGRVLSGPPDNI